MASARRRAWPFAPVKKPGFRWNAGARVPRNASQLTVAGPRRCLAGVTRRLRTTLQEATHTIDRVLLATRITAGRARDAAEHYKNELRGSPAALRIEPAPHFFFAGAARAAAARAHGFFSAVRRAGLRLHGQDLSLAVHFGQALRRRSVARAEFSRSLPWSSIRSRPTSRRSRPAVTS